MAAGPMTGIRVSMIAQRAYTAGSLRFADMIFRFGMLNAFTAALTVRSNLSWSHSACSVLIVPGSILFQYSFYCFMRELAWN